MNDFMITKPVRLINTDSATQISFPQHLVAKQENITVPLLDRTADAVVLHLDYFGISDTDEFLVSNSGVEGYITGKQVKDYFRNSGLKMLYPDIFDPRYAKTVRLA